MGGGGKGVITNLGVQKYFSFYPPCKIYPYLGGAAGTSNQLGGGKYPPPPPNDKLPPPLKNFHPPKLKSIDTPENKFGFLTLG